MPSKQQMLASLFTGRDMLIAERRKELEAFTKRDASLKETLLDTEATISTILFGIADNEIHSSLVYLGPERGTVEVKRYPSARAGEMSIVQIAEKPEVTIALAVHDAEMCPPECRELHTTESPLEATSHSR